MSHRRHGAGTPGTRGGTVSRSGLIGGGAERVAIASTPARKMAGGGGGGGGGPMSASQPTPRQVSPFLCFQQCAFNSIKYEILIVAINSYKLVGEDLVVVLSTKKVNKACPGWTWPLLIVIINITSWLVKVRQLTDLPYLTPVIRSHTPSFQRGECKMPRNTSTETLVHVIFPKPLFSLRICTPSYPICFLRNLARELGISSTG